MGERQTHSRRLVLRPGHDESRVDEFAVSDLGWPRQVEYPADPGEGTERQVVWHGGPSLAMHYFDEVLTDNGFVTVVGKDSDEVALMTDTAEAGLGTWTLDELVQSFDDADGPEETASAVLRAGVGSPHQADERFVERVTTGLRSASPVVREASAWAVACSGWSSYREPLRWMADNDPDADLAKLARMTLDVLPQH